jgi:hypothetical protein
MEKTLAKDNLEKLTLLLKQTRSRITGRPLEPAMVFHKYFKFPPRPQLQGAARDNDMHVIKNVLEKLGLEYMQNEANLFHARACYNTTLQHCEVGFRIDVCRRRAELKQLQEAEDLAFNVFVEACSAPAHNDYHDIPSDPAYHLRQISSRDNRDRLLNIAKNGTAVPVLASTPIPVPSPDPNPKPLAS